MSLWQTHKQNIKFGNLFLIIILDSGNLEAKYYLIIKGFVMEVFISQFCLRSYKII